MSKKPKILIWDLEFKASQTFRGDLRAAPGFITCFGFKELGDKKVQAITILDYPGKNAIDDSNLVREIAKHLKDVDLHVFQYGTKCDWKFIQTRLLRWGQPMLDKPAFFDTHAYASKHLSIRSNSLKSLAYFFGLKESKMEIVEDEWMLSYAGDRKAMAKIAERCKSDVRLTEAVYLKMRPMAINHPAIYKVARLADGFGTTKPTECQQCGGARFKANGFTLSGQNVQQRYRCVNATCQASVFVTIPKKVLGS